MKAKIRNSETSGISNFFLQNNCKSWKNFQVFRVFDFCIRVKIENSKTSEISNFISKNKNVEAHQFTNNFFMRLCFNFTKKRKLLTKKNCWTFHAPNVNVLRITRLVINYVILNKNFVPYLSFSSILRYFQSFQFYVGWNWKFLSMLIYFQFVLYSRNDTNSIFARKMFWKHNVWILCTFQVHLKKIKIKYMYLSI